MIPDDRDDKRVMWLPPTSSPEQPLLRIIWIATALSVHLIVFWQISFQGVAVSTALEVCPYVITGKTAADNR